MSVEVPFRCGNDRMLYLYSRSAVIILDWSIQTGTGVARFLLLQTDKQYMS